MTLRRALRMTIKRALRAAILLSLALGVSLAWTPASSAHDPVYSDLFFQRLIDCMAARMFASPEQRFAIDFRLAKMQSGSFALTVDVTFPVYIPKDSPLP